SARPVGAAGRRRPRRRRAARAAGAPRLSARRAARRASALRDAHPAARDRGGHAALAAARRAARAAAGAHGAGARAGAAGARVRDGHHGPGRSAAQSCGVGGDGGHAVMLPQALRTRVLIVTAMLAVAFTGVTCRLAWLMIVKHGELAQLAERQYSRTVVLQAARGTIVDRQGEPLATSTPAESLFAQPRAIGDPVRVAARLAPILDMPARELHAALTGPRSFVWL